MVEREAPGGQAGQSSRIENYLGFPAGLSGSDLARRATDQARRLGAELLTVQDAVGAARRGRRAARRAQRRRRAERELRARRLRRLLPPARRARLRRADRRRHLLRRGADRGALVRRPARRRHRRRQLRRPGGRATSAATPAQVTMLVRGAVARGVDVALPDRADRRAAEHRGAHRHARRSRPRARTGTCDALRDRAAPTASETLDGRRLLRLHRRLAAHRLARRRRRARRARLHPRRARRPGRRLAAASATRTCWRRRVPGVFVAGDVRARSIKRVASAVGEGSMAVSLIHEYLVERMSRDRAASRCAELRRDRPVRRPRRRRSSREWVAGRRRPRRRRRATIDRRAGRASRPALQLLLEGDGADARSSTAAASSRSAASRRRPGWARSRRSPEAPLGVRMQAETDCRIALDRRRRTSAGWRSRSRRCTGA